MYEFEYDETSRYQIGDVILFNISNVFGELNEFMSIDYTIKGTIVDIIDEGTYLVSTAVRMSNYNSSYNMFDFYVRNEDVKRVIKPMFVEGRLNDA